MLSMNNINDRQKMMEYYRTSDMLNLLYFFPQISPIKDLTIVENKEDYLENQKIYLLCNKVLMESFENLIIVFTNINRHILSTNISCF